MSELRPKSIKAYNNTIIRLEKYFGKDISLSSIDPQQAAVFISEQKNMAKNRRSDLLSDSSREQIKRNCKTMFNAAVTWNLLAQSPFKSIRLKKIVPKRWYRVKPKEYHALLKLVTLRERVAYALFYTAGLRLSEAFSLMWNDIDFERGYVLVAEHKATTSLPPFYIKDYESRRIPIPKHTVDLLAEWQTQAPEGVPYILLTKDRFNQIQIKWQKLQKQKKAWLNEYLINNVLRNFKAQYIRAGIKPVGELTIHTLRKCAGQNWADYMPINVVKEWMGHSDISTTQEFYNQVDKDHEAKASLLIQNLLDTGLTLDVKNEEITASKNN
ncbi:MAG: site-specific integrase [Sedimentisphaerales bacterium]|nr:site-specific integrase [Sedimentisphaerales bacterium]